MDSLTQAVLGASIAGLVVPAEHRRKALLAGAVLGTVPDLDVFIDYGGAVENFTYHRGFSHSLFVLAPFSLLLWLALRRWWTPVRESPGPWLAAISLALLTHPLLDAHTAYGTQILWPLPVPPAMWATLFIIDPLYTLPLVACVVLAVAFPLRSWTTTAMKTALALSTLYIGWSWVAQTTVAWKTESALQAHGLEDAPVFITPTPFNTLLWRIVVQTDDGFLEGFESLVVDEEKIAFERYTSDVAVLNAASDIWAVARLRWFAQDFVKAWVENDQLHIADLRMGQEPSYVFTHIVAERGNPHWQAIETIHIPLAVADRALEETWQRLSAQ